MLNTTNMITRTPLERYALDYGANMEGFVWSKLFPQRTAKKRTFSFTVMDKASLRSERTDAPSGSEANAGEFGASVKNVTLAEHAFKGLVLGRDQRDLDSSIGDLNQQQARLNMSVLMTGMEIAAATKATTAANYKSGLSVTLAAGDTWADPASDPLDDIRTYREAVFAESGRRPNIMIMSGKALGYLRQHPSLVDLFKYTMPGLPTQEKLAQVAELQQIVIADAVKNTATEGAADAISSIWDDNVVLAYVNENDPSRITYGATFVGQDFYTKIIDEPKLGRNLGAHWVESGIEYAFEFLARDGSEDSIAGAVIKNVF
jgi:hypothetical protein